MIKFNNIEIKFGDFTAIKDLTLEVKKGEFFTFLGPSGCGKTTTLRSLVGFIKPTKGNIVVKGEDITDKPIEKRGIGMVFQSYALFPTMTVEENIVFGLKENKWAKDAIRKRVAEVSAMVNLTDEQLKKNVSALSGGQQQRVAIARALALNPEIIVLDEPLSNLDAKLRSQMRVELSKLHRELGATVIYVTHDQVEAMTLGTRIVVMKSGKIQQAATPGDLYQNPVNKFVAGFIGSPAMNFLPVWVERRDERVCLEFGSSRLYVNRMCASRLIEGGYMGRRVYLGIRPEDFHETGPGENALLFEVEIREMLGAEQLLYGNSGRNELCVRMKPEFKAEPGSTVTVFVDMDRIKLFDMETEDNILYL